MKKITIQEIIHSVPRRWERQYPPTNANTSQDRIEIGRKLRKLPLDATPADVAEIIGNESWTRLECGCCDKPVTELVIIEDRYEAEQLSLCESCLDKAIAVLRQEE